MPIMRSTGRLLLAGSALFLLSAAAQAQFGAPFPLSQAGPGDTFAQVAIDAEGDAVVVWHGFDGTDYWVKARSRSATGVLGPIRTLSKGGKDAPYPHVAVDADGDAVVSWYRSDGSNFRVQVRALSAAGALGPIQTLSRAGQHAYPSPIAVDADGDAVIAWWQSDGTSYRIWARSRSAAGVLGRIQALSRAGQDAVAPRVAVDADGDALVTWYCWDGTTYRVQVRSRSDAGILGPIQTLSDASQEASSPEVAVDADGDAVVAWHSSGGIQLRSRSAAGVRGPIQTLSAAGQRVQHPQVAMDDAGDAVVTWSWYDGVNYRVQARSRSATGILGPILTLSEPSQDAHLPQVAIDAGGDAMVTWTRKYWEGSWNVRVQARALSAAGILGPVLLLSEPGQNAYGPEVTTNADGDAVVTWFRYDWTTSQVLGAATP